MNHLHEAIIGLSRAIDDFEAHGWRMRDLGHIEKDSKCANGAISYAVTGIIAYPSSPMLEFTPDHIAVFRTMMRALCDAIPPELAEEVIHKSVALGMDYVEVLQEALGGDNDIGKLESLIVRLNDTVLHDVNEVKLWFSQAIDILAEQLPAPLPTPEVCEESQAPEPELVPA